MIALLQRVSRASVAIGGARVAAIDRGLLVLVGAARADTERDAQRLAERVLGYRVFPDADGKMNLDVCDFGGDILAVPQFTLVADTAKGKRPSFSKAADPEQGNALFESFVKHCQLGVQRVETGRFGADMKVELVNDGPVTFWLEVAGR